VLATAIPQTVLDLIGNTPLVELAGVDTGPCRLFVKLENQNPGGSIKDRIAISMIGAAERSGALSPGGTIVEATAGNTGLGLALVAAAKGYRLILVIPDKMSSEKIAHLRAFGCDIRLTRSDVGPDHAAHYMKMAARIAAEGGFYHVNQFSNPANPLAHEATTGPEIWEQTGHDVDAVVCGVGSGGTMTGLSRFFARVSHGTELVLADPEGSALAGIIREGMPGPESSYAVEGIGQNCIPQIADLSRVRKAYSISDSESFETARSLLRNFGILGGSSSGCLVAAAIRFCKEQTAPKRVVTFICDTGNKYFSKMYSDYWMIDQGYIKRPQTGDIRDLLTRRYEEGSLITVSPDDSLLAAFQRMRLADVSQVPVIEDGQCVGILDESDVLFAVQGHESRFRRPVRTAMTSRLETIPASGTLEDVVRILDRGMVALVIEDEKFLGLITRSDLLAHLRRRMK
jgi:cystathionine beta-synthase